MEILKSRAIDPDFAAAAGARTETDGRTNGHHLNWSYSAKPLGACLVMKYCDLDGDQIAFKDAKHRTRFLYALRPTNPLQTKPKKEGEVPKVRKYERPKGSRCRLYLVRQLAAKYKDKAEPLIVAESELKALSAASNGFTAVGISGTECWSKPGRPKTTDGKPIGPRELLDDFKSLKLNKRRVYIAFDSDLATNDNVARSAKAFLAALRRAGAVASILTIPMAPDGGKQGLDDFIAAHGAEAFQALLDSSTGVTTDAKDDADTEPKAEGGAEAKPEAEAKPKNKKEPKPPPPPLEVPDGVEVVLVGVDEHRVNSCATVAIAKDTTLYERGGILVQVIEQSEADGAKNQAVRRSAGAPYIRPMPEASLREKLTEHVMFVALKGRGDDAKEVPVHPPAWCTKAMLARGSWPGVRQLASVVSYPLVKPDGSILATNGHDPTTGLLVRLDPDLTIDVAAKPTEGNLKQAVADLLDPIRDFPFAKPEHKGAFVAGILTPLAWLLFDGPAPFFLIDKNVRGAGAGLLVDVAGIILTGRRFPIMSYSHKAEELRKKITTLAVAGERMVLIDNLTGSVGCDVLDAALTATTWRDRLLGLNAEYNGPLELTWWGTANNAQLRADFSRRICHILLFSELEKPERRDDVSYTDLRGYVHRHRSKLLSAALTILRAWHVAGRPRKTLPPWGSYEGWSDVVRQAVVFAGLEDPGLTRDALQAEADRPAVAMAEIIRLWPNLNDYRNHGLSAAEIVARIKEQYAETVVSAWVHELRDAVEELCGRLDGVALGYKFRQFARRNFAGYMVVKAGAVDGNKSNKWTVKSVQEARNPEMPKPSPEAEPRHNPEQDKGVPESGEGRSGDTGDNVRQARNRRRIESAYGEEGSAL